jgi:K+-sensing histidine kinase KdpD
MCIDEKDNCSAWTAGDLAQLSSLVDEICRDAEKAQQESAAARMKLQLSERYRLDFFSNVTHDLKTPITAIKGASDLLLLQNCNNPKCITYHNLISRNIARLTVMVQNMLDYSRLQTGTLDIKIELCDLAEIVEDAMLTAIPVAWENNIDVKYTAPDRSFNVNGDCERLEQSLYNLLIHAIYSSPPGADIFVDIGESEDGYMVSLAFEDHELSNDEHEIIFDRYLRGEMKEKRREQGLGLAISKGIIKLHKGDVMLQTESLPCVALAVFLPAAGEQAQLT